MFYPFRWSQDPNLGIGEKSDLRHRRHYDHVRGLVELGFSPAQWGHRACSNLEFAEIVGFAPRWLNYGCPDIMSYYAISFQYSEILILWEEKRKMLWNVKQKCTPFVYFTFKNVWYGKRKGLEIERVRYKKDYTIVQWKYILRKVFSSPLDNWNQRFLFCHGLFSFAGNSREKEWQHPFCECKIYCALRRALSGTAPPSFLLSRK